MGGLLSSSIARKVAMALSALFLIIFLIIHIAVNLTSLFSEEVFNDISHFMGTNPLIQFAMQPVLIFGVVFHFVLGFVLELKNRRARNVKYAKFNGAASATWMSRNMVVSGAVILAFLVLQPNFLAICLNVVSPDFPLIRKMNANCCFLGSFAFLISC